MSISSYQDTIFAPASGAGRAAVAIIRISGPDSGLTLDRMCHTRPLPRRASLRLLRDHAGEILDKALVLWVPGPRSFTGEDCAELHVHGGPIVVRDVSLALANLGLRPAEAGEFSKRAFLNGCIDLVEAEGIADLVDAETTAQRRQALQQMEGGLGRILKQWTQVIAELLARQEALIDFPDEDLPSDVAGHIDLQLPHVLTEMQSYLSDYSRGERLRQGLVFAILGAPNAGKSSLLNVLADRDVAIVSSVAGTTRDIVEARLEIAGVPVTILDTAGIRATDDSVETEGVRRALASGRTADLLIIVDSPQEPAPEFLPDHPSTIRVLNKSDLLRVDVQTTTYQYNVAVSAKTGDGIPQLIAIISKIAEDLTQSTGPPPLTRARHRAALKGAIDNLMRAQHSPYPELRAEDLRLALRALGRITGRVGVEDILDSIFRQFCIGK